jgi:2-dehydro-3-deoxygluconokinase
MKESWFVGECMVELRRAAPGLLAQSFAGDVYNTSIYFSRSARSSRSCFISSVGTDNLSSELLAEATAHGVATEHVMRVSSRIPGLYWIETGQNGERSFLYWRDQSAARCMLDVPHHSRLRDRLDACGLLYFSGITLAILDDTRRDRLLQLAREVRQAGATVAFDSNYRRLLWENKAAALHWTDAALRIATHALVTLDDEIDLHGDADAGETLRRTLAAGPGETIVKLGEAGCLVQLSAMPAPVAIPAEKTEPVDTTAAGDSFNGAYLAARQAGADTAEAARLACRLAARVVSYPGAIITPAQMELEQLR